VEKKKRQNEAFKAKVGKHEKKRQKTQEPGKDGEIFGNSICPYQGKAQGKTSRPAVER